MIHDVEQQSLKKKKKKKKKRKIEKKLKDFFNKTQKQKILRANLVDRHVWRVEK